MSNWFRAPLLWAAAAVATTLGATARPAAAEVQTKDVKYAVGGTEYVGFLAFDDKVGAHADPDKRPGVLVAPEWIGLNDYAKTRARQLAGMGYVAFVFDPYGGGKTAASVKEAAAWSSALKADRPELRARVSAAFATLKKQPHVDPAKTAAIGYCFGGTSVLELARTGADVLGVVSFHGGLSTPLPAKAGELKAKVLACHGAVDPFVKPEEVAAFEKEMADAKADWSLVSYGGAMHSFTNPGADGVAVPGAKYNEAADKRSWTAMQAFFGELFGGGGHEHAAADRPAADLAAGEPAGDGVVVLAAARVAASAPAPAGRPAEAARPGAIESRRVVFVCDATGTMISKLSSLKEALKDAINDLQPTQAFDVVFYTDGGKVVAADRANLILATPEGKRKVFDWLADVTASGTTDPIPAIKLAFALRPQADLVFFFSDGEFNNLRSYDEVKKAFNAGAGGRKVKVNTILFETYDKEAEKVLMAIAEAHDGAYKFVMEKDVQR